MKHFFALAAALLIAVLPASAYAQEPAKGTISGQVVNDTRGGGSVAGVEITLITYVNDAISETRATVADREGKFQFDDVTVEHTYLVSARYMGVDYYYQVAFESGETKAHVEVGVCDVTTSDQVIRANMAHVVIDVAEESFKITRVYWLFNDSDMTYVGTDGVLVFSLPEGAYDFEAPQELMMDYEFLDNNTIAYLVPFPPGERQIVYSYKLQKPDGHEFTIPLQVDYPADSLEIMIASEDIEVSVSQLAPADPVVTNSEERYMHFHGENITRGTMVNLSLSNLSGGGGFPPYIAWIIIGLIVIGIVVYLMFRRRGGSGG